MILASTEASPDGLEEEAKKFRHKSHMTTVGRFLCKDESEERDEVKNDVGAWLKI